MFNLFHLILEGRGSINQLFSGLCTTAALKLQYGLESYSRSLYESIIIKNAFKDSKRHRVSNFQIFWTEVLVNGYFDSKLKKQNLKFLTFNNIFKDQLHSNF